MERRQKSATPPHFDLDGLIDTIEKLAEEKRIQQRHLDNNVISHARRLSNADGCPHKDLCKGNPSQRKDCVDSKDDVFVDSAGTSRVSRREMAEMDCVNNDTHDNENAQDIRTNSICGKEDKSEDTQNVGANEMSDCHDDNHNDPENFKTECDDCCQNEMTPKNSDDSTLVDTDDYTFEELLEERLVQGISEEHIQSVQSTWQTIFKNKKTNGVDFFIMLFREHPAYQQLFGLLRAVPLAELRTSTNMKAHGLTFMLGLNAFIENLDDCETLAELVKKNAERHAKRDIDMPAFEHMWSLFPVFLKEKLEEQFDHSAQEAWNEAITFINDVTKMCLEKYLTQYKK